MELPVLLICLSYFLSASAWPYHCRSCQPSYWSRRCQSCQTNEDTNLSLADGEDDYASNQEEDAKGLKPVAIRWPHKSNDLPYYPVKPFPYPSIINRYPPNEPIPSPQNSPKPCTYLYWPYPPRPQKPNDEDSTSDSNTTETTSTESTSTKSTTSESNTTKTRTPKRAKKRKHSKHKYDKPKPPEGNTINF